MTTKQISFTLLIIILLSSLSVSANATTFNKFNSQAAPIAAEIPKVTLLQGTAGTSTIYTNSTSAKVSISPTWLNDFQYRKKIIFNNSAISENLVNFTVPIIFNSSNTDFWGHAQQNGNDTRFIDADNTTELYYEFERFNHTSDDMVAWVRVPQIDANSAADYIWIYYGNSTVNFDSYSSRSSNAWDSNYVAVYHFKDASGSKITDSTLQNNATLYGGGLHWTSGQIGGAYNFDGTNDYAIINANIAFDVSTYTIEAWSKPNSTGIWTNIMGQNDTTTGPSKFQFSAGNSATNLASDFGGPTWHSLEATNSLTNNVWNWYADRIDMANTNQSLWKNGALVASQSQTTYPCTYANGSKIGIGADAFGAYKFRGTIDELRFSKIARSANWMKACYQYQVNRSQFAYASENTNAVSDVLNVTNQVASPWKVRLRAYDQTNIGRLANCTINFRNSTGVFRQIYVYNGAYSQQVGSWYDLTSLSTIYISMSVTASTTGTSQIYAYLEVQVPNTSTSNLMVVTFEVS